MPRQPVAAWLLLACGAFCAAAGDAGVAAGTGNGEVAAEATATACSNFGQVGPGVYRGAEPDEACLKRLATLGIALVVNLRDDDEDSGREQARVVALGMRYANLPLSGFGRPSKAEVRRILAAIGAPENQPVFVHCRHGRDRTGVIIAARRMVHEGWAVDRAIQEARDFGLAWWQFRMKQFILDFGAEVASTSPRSGNR